MDEHVELTGLVKNPAARRLLLLLKALQHVPFEEAIELARTAEGFVTGFRDSLAVEAKATTAPSREPESGEDMPKRHARPQPGEESIVRGPGPIALSTEQRDHLLTLFAEGARNAELASKFGLSAKQVQGIRMGCAREIAKRRDQLSRTTAEAGETMMATVSVDEVVRYLRQQDDIVVPQENGEFLVNARFHLPMADLTARANRMRARQGKPKFEFPGISNLPKQIASANGHPLFWEQTALDE